MAFDSRTARFLPDRRSPRRPHVFKLLTGHSHQLVNALAVGLYCMKGPSASTKSPELCGQQLPKVVSVEPRCGCNALMVEYSETMPRLRAASPSGRSMSMSRCAGWVPGPGHSKVGGQHGGPGTALGAHEDQQPADGCAHTHRGPARGGTLEGLGQGLQQRQVRNSRARPSCSAPADRDRSARSRPWWWQRRSSQCSPPVPARTRDHCRDRSQLRRAALRAGAHLSQAGG